MPINVRIPTPLRQLTGGEEVVTVTAANVGAAIAEMQAKYPGIKDRLLDDKGEEDIRFLQSQATPLKDGDEISIIPAIAGG
jgi:molybdopterin synthase sulfur carrier subunit